MYGGDFCLGWEGRRFLVVFGFVILGVFFSEVSGRREVFRFFWRFLERDSRGAGFEVLRDSIDGIYNEV